MNKIFGMFLIGSLSLSVGMASDALAVVGPTYVKRALVQQVGNEQPNCWASNGNNQQYISQDIYGIYNTSGSSFAIDCYGEMSSTITDKGRTLTLYGVSPNSATVEYYPGSIAWNTFNCSLSIGGGAWPNPTVGLGTISSNSYPPPNYTYSPYWYFLSPNSFAALTASPGTYTRLSCTLPPNTTSHRLYNWVYTPLYR